MNDTNGIHRTRLFSGICLALIPTGASFALLGNVLGQLKEEFILTNAHVGFIAGAGIWGMAISLLVLGPLLEGFGMKKGTMAAFAGHVTGLVLMIASAPFAGTDLGFWLLTLGAIVLAMGHGMIEVAGNPLTAALYPENKTTRLNWFHAFFPGGILLGSLIGFGLNQLTGPLFHWTFQLGIVLIPVLVYGFLVLPQKFPKTENAAAGLPVGEMFRYTLTNPFLYVMVLMLGIAVSIELGAGRWLPEVFARVGMEEGILLLSWISLIMVVLRLNAGFFVSKFTPPGLLACGGVLMALGMYLFGVAGGTPSAFLAATFFGLGVTFFFPTCVGIVSERMPRSGSLGIVLLCGVGLALAGGVGTPGVGIIFDAQLASHMNSEENRSRTVQVLEGAVVALPVHRDRAAQAEDPLAEVGFLAADVENVISSFASALENYEAAGQQIVGNSTPQALRALIGLGISEDQEPLIAQAKAVLGPAEAYGGQRALLLISWVPLILFVVFGAMYLRDRSRGGYKAIQLTKADTVIEKAAEDVSKPIPGPGHK